MAHEKEKSQTVVTVYHSPDAPFILGNGEYKFFASSPVTVRVTGNHVEIFCFNERKDDE